MREKLASMIEVKKIIALLLTGTFIYLSVIKVIDPMQYMSIYTLIIGFYFGQSTSAQAQIRTLNLEKQTDTKEFDT